MINSDVWEKHLNEKFGTVQEHVDRIDSYRTKPATQEVAQPQQESGGLLDGLMDMVPDSIKETAKIAYNANRLVPEVVIRALGANPLAQANPTTKHVQNFARHAGAAMQETTADLAKFAGDPLGVGTQMSNDADLTRNLGGETLNLSDDDVTIGRYITDPNGLASGFGDMVGSMIPMYMTGAGLGGALGKAAQFLATTGRGAKVANAVANVPWLSRALSSQPVKWARNMMLSAPVEGMVEGGGKMFDLEAQGMSPEDARSRGVDVALKNIPALMATNAVEGLVGGKIMGNLLKGLSKGGTGALRSMAAATPPALVGMATNAYEEGMQEGISRSVEDNTPYSYNLYEMLTNPELVDQKEVFLHGLIDTSPLTLLGIGGAGVAGRRRNIAANAAQNAATTPQGEASIPTSQSSISNAYAESASRWIDEQMPNGKKGCVEAVVRIGSGYNPFLEQMRHENVVSVPTLIKKAEEAGVPVIDFDASKLETGDVIIYDGDEHVVTYDGNGGYVGNSSSQNKVVHENDYTQMNGLQPTGIIKTSTDGAYNADMSIDTDIDGIGMTDDEAEDLFADDKFMGDFAEWARDTSTNSEIVNLTSDMFNGRGIFDTSKKEELKEAIQSKGELAELFDEYAKMREANTAADVEANIDTDNIEAPQAAAANVEAPQIETAPTKYVNKERESFVSQLADNPDARIDFLKLTENRGLPLSHEQQRRIMEGDKDSIRKVLDVITRQEGGNENELKSTGKGSGQTEAAQGINAENPVLHAKPGQAETQKEVNQQPGQPQQPLLLGAPQNPTHPLQFIRPRDNGGLLGGLPIPREETPQLGASAPTNAAANNVPQVTPNTATPQERISAIINGAPIADESAATPANNVPANVATGNTTQTAPQETSTTGGESTSDGAVVGTHIHTKTKEAIPKVSIKTRVPSEVIRPLAKKHNGWWGGKYAKAYLFKTQEDAENFAREINEYLGVGETAREESAENEVKADTTEQEAKPNAQGEEKSTENAPQENTAEKQGKRLEGKTVEIITDNGTSIKAKYVVMEAADVTASNNAEDFSVNKDYPQELQPRDRNRAAMRQQVVKMASHLRPEDLTEGRNLNQGAPVVRPDGVVLNGNGRVLAIEMAQEKHKDRRTKYIRHLMAEAGRLGINPAELRAWKPKRPILVRMLLENPSEELTQEIINSTVGGSMMGASEQAEADAKKLKTAAIMDSYEDNDRGDLHTVGNAQFVSKVLHKIANDNEINGYTMEDGSFSQDGINRVTRALFARAFDNSRMISKFTEAVDDESKNITAALLRATPLLAKHNILKENGEAYDIGVLSPIVEAVRRIEELRKQNKKVEDELNEGVLFDEHAPSEETKAVMRFIDKNKFKAGKLGEFFRSIAKQAIEAGNPKQTNLIETSLPTPMQIIDRAASLADNDGMQDMFAGADKKEDAEAREKTAPSEDKTETEQENSDNAIVVTGKEFGDYADVGELRQAVAHFWDRHLRNWTLHNDVVGDVKFLERLYTYAPLDEDELLLVRRYPKLFQSAKKVSESTDSTGRTKYIHLRAKCTIKGKEEEFECSVVQETGGAPTILPFRHTVETVAGRRIKDAIDSKNIQKIRDMLLSNDNKHSRKVFSTITGVNLFKKQGERMAQLEEFFKKEWPQEYQAEQDAKAKTEQEESDKKAKEAAEKQAAIDAEYHGFLKGKKPLVAGAIRKVLQKKYNYAGNTVNIGVKTRAEFIEHVAENYPNAEIKTGKARDKYGNPLNRDAYHLYLDPPNDPSKPYLTGPGYSITKGEAEYFDYLKSLQKEKAAETTKEKVEQQIPKIIEMVANDEAYQNAIKNSDEQNARSEYESALKRAVLSTANDNLEFYKEYQDNKSFREWLTEKVFAETYKPEEKAAETAREESVQNAEASEAENIAMGKSAIEKALSTKQDVDKAMYRPETGYIDFVYGKEGDPQKKYKGGYGLAKILAKHGQESIDAIPEVIAKGKVSQKYPDRMYITHDKYLAVVRLDFDGEKKTWLVTNYEQTEEEIKTDSNPVEVIARSTDTADIPQSNVGVESASANVTQGEKIVNENQSSGKGEVSSPADSEKVAQFDADEMYNGFLDTFNNPSRRQSASAELNNWMLPPSRPETELCKMIRAATGKEKITQRDLAEFLAAREPYIQRDKSKNSFFTWDGHSFRLDMMAQHYYKHIKKMLESSTTSDNVVKSEARGGVEDERQQAEGESIGRGLEGVQSSGVPQDEETVRREDDRGAGEVSGQGGQERGIDVSNAESADTRGAKPAGKGTSGVRSENDGAGNGTGNDKISVHVNEEDLPPSQRTDAPAKETAGHNYRIDVENVKDVGEKTKFKDNIEAIKLLKKLEESGRMATPAEQEVLAKYHGWGPLANAFTFLGEWKKASEELKSLLTKDEYAAARASANTAYYTDPKIVSKLWELVRKLGFTGGKVLDPSMGVGNFFGTMPQDMAAKSMLTGVEIDPLTARIASQLYQKASVRNEGFEEINGLDNFFDLAISNVPFGDIKVHDPKFNKYKYMIHNYFFAKAMDKVRPGGLVVFITNQGTLQRDEDAATLRRELNEQADLITAIKLPDTAFKNYSGTEVLTDVIVLRKRDESGKPHKDGQSISEPITLNITPSDSKISNYAYPVKLNPFYTKMKGNLIGKMDAARDQWGNVVFALKGKGYNIVEKLGEIISKLPEGVYTKPKQKTRTTTEAMKAEMASTKDRAGAFVVKDGVAKQNVGGVLHNIDKKDQEQVKAYVTLRNSLKSLLTAELDEKCSEDALKVLRRKLNEAYDAYVKKAGYLNDPKKMKVIQGDPDAGMVMALEKPEYEKSKKGKSSQKKFVKATKADIFKERSVEPIKLIQSAGNVSDALAASLSTNAAVDIDYMAKLMGVSTEKVRKDAKGLIFLNPDSGEYETANEYLSGKVVEKLEQAREAAKNDSAYKENVEALEKVQPRKLTHHEFTTTFGATWVPEGDTNAYINSLLTDGEVKVKWRPATGKWEVTGWGYSNDYKVNNESRYSFTKLIEHALNNVPFKMPKHDYEPSEQEKNRGAQDLTAAQDLCRKIGEGFSEYLWKDNARTERLEAIYNRLFNSTRNQEYDGSHLTFPGKNAKITLRKHQADAVWRIIQSGRTLLAHCVGAGKTFTMQAAAMEMRRLGIAKKPLFAVPNNVVHQFAREYRQLYPQAKILVVDSSDLPAVMGERNKKGEKNDPAKRSSARAKRNALLSRIRMEDWDGIIMSHNVLERMPMQKEVYVKFLEERKAELEKAKRDELAFSGKEAGARFNRSLDKALANIEVEIKKALSVEKKDVGIGFDELGVDHLFVDEADMFKNLMFVTSMENVSGISTSKSNRSMDMFMKTQWLSRNHGGITFATGTPISNSLNEMFTMQRYLAMDTLKELNVVNFDAWARAFAQIYDKVERDPSGIGYRTVQGMKFSNLDELVNIFRGFADVKNADDLDLKVPKLKNGKPTIVSVKASPAFKTYLQETIMKRVLECSGKRIHQKGEDNMLAITNDLRKASVDMRLVDPNLSAEGEGAKVKALADQAARVYKETEATNGTQLIFCDISTPKSSSDEEDGKKKKKKDDEDSVEEESAENITMYSEIKRELVSRGIPSEQIVFIHDAKNKAQQSEIFERVNDGEVRILIGSTEKMGAGTNCQKHMAALHHFTCPWRPRDIEQRNGRILRQGNENEEVEIFEYVTEGSYDANLWEKIKHKAMMIADAMSQRGERHNIDDSNDNTISYAEAEALATDNPLMREKTEVDTDVTRLESLKSNFNREKGRAETDYRRLPQTIERIKNMIANIKKDIDEQKSTAGDKFVAVIGKTTYTKREDAEKSLQKILAAFRSNESTTIGNIGGYEIKAAMVNGAVKLQLVNNSSYEVNTFSIKGIEYTANNAAKSSLAGFEKMLSSYEQELKDVKERLNKTFQYEGELQKLKKRQAEILEAMKPKTVADGEAEQTTENEADTAGDEGQQAGEKKYSAVTASEETTARVKDEVKAEVERALPNGKVVSVDEDGNATVEMPNGKRVRILLSDDIVVNDAEREAAKKEHNLQGDDIVIEAYWERVSGLEVDGVLAISSLSRAGTTYHEAMHMAMDMALTAKEKADLIKRYQKEADAKGISVDEAITEGYKAWKLAREKGQTSTFGKLHRKMNDLLQQISDLFHGRESQSDIFERVASGEVWERDKEAVQEVEAIANNAIDNLTASMDGKRHYSATSRDNKVVVVEKTKNPNYLNPIRNIIQSPSRIIEKAPQFKQFFTFADNAMRKLLRNRELWNRRLDVALGYARDAKGNKLTEKERKELLDILSTGDIEAKEYSHDEIVNDFGCSEAVAESYKNIRNLLDTIRKRLNEAHCRVQRNTKHVNAIVLEDMRKSKFIEIVREKEVERGVYLVTFDERPTREKNCEVAESVYRRMEGDEAIEVLDAEETGTDQLTGETMYKLRIKEAIPSIGKPKGYMPHFFHEFLVCTVKDGIIGSGKTISEAEKIAKKWLDANPKADAKKVTIMPKSFDFSSLGMDMSNNVVVGDQDYFRMQSALQEKNEMSLEEARELLDGLVRRTGRHRHLGNLYERTGAKGYEKDMEWVLRHYANITARYVALETEFKPKAVSLFERYFGRFDNADYSGVALYARNFIKDFNGDPSAAEKSINEMLNRSEVWKKILRRLEKCSGYYGERAALQLTNSLTNLMSVAKLGMNVSSAMLNFTQLVNASAYLSAPVAVYKATGKEAIKTIVHGVHKFFVKSARGKYDRHDMRILAESGVLYDLGLDSGAGYGQMSLGSKAGKFLSDIAMFSFKHSEAIVRRATVLAAYEIGRKRGMSHQQAIDYARDINRKSNFEYGVHDAPNVFRRLSGTVIGPLGLQFQKYPIKELEVMSDMAPLFAKGTSTRQKMIFWGQYMLMAGLMGLPLTDLLGDLLIPFGMLLGAILPDGVLPNGVLTGNTKARFKQAIMEAAGDNPVLQGLAKVTMYGAPSLFGVDVSGRAGMADAFDVLDAKVTDLTGATGDTVQQMLEYGQDWNIRAMLKAFSPGLSNIWSAIEGYSVGSRGRVNYTYDSLYDRVLKAIGFRSVEESIDYDKQKAIRLSESGITDRKQKAVDEYLKNPTAENKARLKELGVKDKTVDTERKKKDATRGERFKSGMSKEAQKRYEQLMKFE